MQRRLSAFAWLMNIVLGQSIIVHLIWGTLAVAFVWALIVAQWSLAFVSLATFVASVLPAVFFERFGIKLPFGFFAFIVIFVFATLFLGEAFDFYERLWWWDLLLHGGSAIGFGLLGFLFMLMLFHGDRYAAPPLAISFMAWCFALSIGVCWELFEFAVDQIFGANMQKSGLIDTMSDLAIDALGASIGAAAGFLYLKGIEFGGFAGLIRDFIRQNRRLFSKFRDDNKRD